MSNFFNRKFIHMGFSCAIGRDRFKKHYKPLDKREYPCYTVTKQANILNFHHEKANLGKSRGAKLEGLTRGEKVAKDSQLPNVT